MQHVKQTFVWYSANETNIIRYLAVMLKDPKTAIAFFLNCKKAEGSMF